MQPVMSTGHLGRKLQKRMDNQELLFTSFAFISRTANLEVSRIRKPQPILNLYINSDSDFIPVHRPQYLYADKK